MNLHSTLRGITHGFTPSHNNVHKYYDLLPNFDYLLPVLRLVLSARPAAERFTSSREPSTPEPARGTVFLDLRKTQQNIEEEKNRLAVVQRVLKINERE